jgi:hypothetical protein
VERGSVKLQHFLIWTVEKGHISFLKGCHTRQELEKGRGVGVGGQVRSAPDFALRGKKRWARSEGRTPGFRTFFFRLADGRKETINHEVLTQSSVWRLPNY